MMKFLFTLFFSFIIFLGYAGKYQSPLMVDLKTDLPKGIWRLDEKNVSSTIEFDLEKLKINPAFYDEIQIEFANHESLIMLAVKLTDFPVKDLAKSYYSKIPLISEQVNDWRLDLQLDDDGISPLLPQKNAVVYNGQKLVLTLQKRYLRTPNESQTREVEIKNIRFLRRPVKISFDEFEAKFSNKDGNLVWEYYLTLFNTELKEVDVELNFARSNLKNFTLSWTNKTVTLPPRTPVKIPLKLSISENLAKTLPALYSERVLPEIRIKSEADLPAFYPLIGYRYQYVYATIPPQKVSEPTVEITNNTKLINDANQALATQWSVPEFGPAQHNQQYIDKANNSKLKALSYFRHQSIKTGEILPFSMYINQANIDNIHIENFKRALLLMQAYQLSKNVEYAQAARDVFLEYVRIYPHIGRTSSGSTGYRSKLGQSTLMTSFYFSIIADAYELLCRSEILSQYERNVIENEFIVPEMRGLYGHNIEYTNMQIHHFQVYSQMVAVMNKHWNLLGEALYGDHGFFNIIEHSFSEDGLSQEGAVYHIFALSPLIKFAKQMKNLGINVMNERFKRVFDGMVLDTADGILRKKNYAEALNFAYECYQDKNYLPTLRYHKMSDKLGGKTLETSTHQKHNGYLMLREKSPYGLRALSINYIMIRDRLEFDRLHFNLFDLDMLCTEVGRINYGSPHAKLMYKTVSHNSFVVDKQDQKDVSAQLACFIDRPLMPAALIIEDAQASLYEGVKFSRVVAILDGIFFVGDLISSDKEHLYDWPFYGLWEPWAEKEVGRFTLNTPLKDGKIDYPFMADVKTAKMPENLFVTMPVGTLDVNGQRITRNAANKLLGITFASQDDMSVFTTTTPRGHMPENGPMLLLRKQAKDVAFGAAFEVLPLKNATARVKKVELIESNKVNGVWKITSDKHQYLIKINRENKNNKLEIEKL